MKSLIFEDMTNKKYTDIQIILCNNNDHINIFAHKIILANSSSYFDKLFNFGTEKNQKEIKITVDNIKIAHDLILSFYGKEIIYSDWKYILEMFKCRSFFCLQNDSSLLYDMKVPIEGFDLLLNIMDEFDVFKDDKLIMALKKNLPDNYDLNNFTTEMKNKILNKLKIIACCDKTIKIWDMDSGILLNTIRGQVKTCNPITSNNTNIVSCTKDKTIQIWDVKTGSLLHILNGHSDIISSVAISRDNTIIVSGSYDRSIRIWDINTGALLRTLNGHDSCVLSIAITSDNARIVSGSRDGSVKIWDIKTGSLLRTLYGHGGWVKHVLITSDNSKIISSFHGTIKIWDMVTASLLHTIITPSPYIECMTITTDNLEIVSGRSRGIDVWDIETGSLLNSFTDHVYHAISVATTLDNSFIVFTSDYHINIMDMESGSLLRKINCDYCTSNVIIIDGTVDTINKN